MIRVCWWVPGRPQVLGKQFRVLPSDYRPRRDDSREFQVGRFPDFLDTSDQLFRRSSHYPFKLFPEQCDETQPKAAYHRQRSVPLQAARLRQMDPCGSLQAAFRLIGGVRIPAV